MPRDVFAALVCLPVIASVAYASPMVSTGMLPAGAVGGMYCSVVNTGSQPANVTIEFVGAGGVAISPPGPVVVAIEPGARSGLVRGTRSEAYCRVTGVSPRKVRVLYCTTDANGDCTATATAP